MAINGIKSFKVTTISLYFLLLRHMAVLLLFFSSYTRLLLYNIMPRRRLEKRLECRQLYTILSLNNTKNQNVVEWIEQILPPSLSLSFCVCFTSILQQVVCTCLIRIQNSCKSIFIFIWHQNDARKWHFTIPHSINHEFRKIIK